MNISDRWVHKTLNSMSHEALVALLNSYGFDCTGDTEEDLREAVFANLEDETIPLEVFAEIAEEIGTNE